MKATTADRLKEVMKRYELRQVDILKRAEPYCKQYEIKMGRNDLSQYVSGKVSPGQDKLTILALALGVSETWLMGYDVPMERNGHEDPELLKRDAILEDIEDILKNEGYTLFCENYDDDYFLVKDLHNQTVIGFYDYDLLAKYNYLQKKGKVTANLLLSSETTFFKYLGSLGYYISRDDLEHKPFIHYDNGTVRIEPDTLDSIRTRIDTYAKATIDSEILALQEKEIKLERLEKERLVRHLRDKNVYSCSQFDKDRKTYLEADAAHQRTDLSKGELNDAARNKHDDEIMDDPNF
ncbi:hypothetical protein ABFV83_02125 [Lacrimispora sp. BS-2]|uniref:HTH cro/C1-type domain-containing protein n=1 Tax=Lacrimispora sp. BS-2 TaxID=3151850 RepID=A0AAU7PRD4_9FIRM